MLRLLLPALFVLSLLACGIKGPPRPPLDAVAPPSPAQVSAPDAGCCQEAR
jgi:predicted small lipoprotein YifL